MHHKNTKAPSHKKETDYYLNWLGSLEIEGKSKERISQCLYWYLEKARYNKLGFYCTAVLSMVLSSSIPVINGLTNNGTPTLAKVLVSVFAALSAFAVGLNSLFSYREKWNRNRISAEKLKREIALFQAKAGKYSPEETKEPQKILTIETEKLFTDEASDWLQGQEKKPGVSYPGKAP